MDSFISESSISEFNRSSSRIVGSSGTFPSSTVKLDSIVSSIVDVSLISVSPSRLILLASSSSDSVSDTSISMLSGSNSPVFISFICPNSGISMRSSAWFSESLSASSSSASTSSNKTSKSIGFAILETFSISIENSSCLSILFSSIFFGSVSNSIAEDSKSNGSSDGETTSKLKLSSISFEEFIESIIGSSSSITSSILGPSTISILISCRDTSDSEETRIFSSSAALVVGENSNDLKLLIY